MKNLKVFLLVVGLLFLAMSPAVTQEDLGDSKFIIDKEGKVIYLSKEAHFSSEEEREAVNNPGKEVPMGDFTTIYERTSFFRYCLTKIYSQVVVYENDRMQTIEKEFVSKAKDQLAFYVAFGLAAIIFMIISNIILLSLKRFDGDVASALALASALASALAFISALASALASIFALASISALALALASALASASASTSALAYSFTLALAFVSASDSVSASINEFIEEVVKNQKKYFIFSVIFYICMLFVIFV